MRRYSILVLVVLLVFSIFTVLGCQGDSEPPKEPDKQADQQEPADEYGPPDEVTKLVFQPCFDSGDAGWAKGIVPWIEAVEEATEGTVKIELLPSGSITSGDEAFGACASGVTDIFAGWATVYGGDMPEGMLAYGMAMGAENFDEAWEAMWGDPKYRIGDIVQEAANAQNMHWVGWTDQGPNSAFTKFPIRSLEDFAGHKLRAGGPQAIFLKAMGGTPVALDASEIYMSITLGTIEGTLWDWSGMQDMKFYEVIQYGMMPGWCPAQHQEIYMNLDKWNSLTDWQRDQIESVFESTYFLTSQMHHEGVEQSMKALEDSGGEVVYLSDTELERIRLKAIEEIWPETAALSDLCAKGVDIWKQYLEDKGKI
jgi:TRAP-type C4-dicarboxylate transport system substrate-binding protein